MDTSDVRRYVVETIERARRRAAERRVRAEEATHAYERLLERTAVPLVRQIANALRAHGYPFEVFTPSGSVRLSSERASEDYIELTLDTTEAEPSVVIHARRSRGRRVIESERAIGGPAALTERDLVTAMMQELEPLVER
jgi:hypothetical protein